jgi:hypothetical protein
MPSAPPAQIPRRRVSAEPQALSSPYPRPWRSWRARYASTARVRSVRAQRSRREHGCSPALFLRVRLLRRGISARDVICMVQNEGSRAGGLALSPGTADVRACVLSRCPLAHWPTGPLAPPARIPARSAGGPGGAPDRRPLRTSVPLRLFELLNTGAQPYARRSCRARSSSSTQARSPLI